MRYKGGEVERHLYYSKEKLGDDSPYSLRKAELRDLEISKNWVVSFGRKKKCHHLMAPVRIINGALMITVFIRHFCIFPPHFLTDKFSPRPSRENCTGFRDIIALGLRIVCHFLYMKS